MKSEYNKVFKFVSLLQKHKRISVRRMSDELGVTQSAIYRMVRSAAPSFPVKLKLGIIVLENELAATQCCESGQNASP